MRFTAALVLVLVLASSAGRAGAQESLRELRFEIDDAAGRPLPCRIHLFDPAGKPVQAVGLPFFRDHFSCEGRATLKLPVGRYRYEIERGPEYTRLAGEVDVPAGNGRTVGARLRRIAELARLGWWSGDLHIHRPLKDVELLMRAEDLHVGPVITWWNKTNPWAAVEPPATLLRRFDGDRFVHVMAGEDERGGGALLYFDLERPLPITGAAREHPASPAFAADARAAGKAVHIDAEKPFWWDVPAWVAGAACDTVGIANNHMCRSTVYPGEAWGRPRDKARLPDPAGNGLWSQEIYYHVLNCGVRLPPSAGSASGVLPNPVGYNRVYVQLDGEPEWSKWWQGLRAGRSFVTNGPLLPVSAEGRPPGQVFRAESGPMELKLDLSLIALDRVAALEIVQDGRIAATLALDGAVEQRRTATVTFRESGWFLVRAIAENRRTFRFASTAPFYVEVGGKPRVSRKSAEFFVAWVKERTEQLERALSDDDRRREVLKFQAAALRYWQDKAAAATAE
jgi:hypothetical protein